MAYAIELRPRARRAFSKLSHEAKTRVQLAINKLADTPRPPGFKQLRGNPSLLRIRTGNYRVIYQVFDDRLVIVVVDLGHRQGAYKNL
ncbi:MAG: type II toxin-antitoxin system RelE/ParE family toxin [Verrucomicrobia bacterium]|nr:type II toxin-antitoxin system RelE/ParE family toxin [Verrucomicrobiota bacterium]